MAAEPVTTALFQPGDVLPPSTWLSGTLFTVYGSVHPKEGDGLRLGFILRCQLPEPSAPASDYAMPINPQKKIRYTMTVFLWMNSADPGAAERMEADRKVLLALNGKPLDLDGSGLKVASMSKTEKGIDVKLEGSEERTVKTATRTFKLLSAPLASATAPSWYDSGTTGVSSPSQAKAAPPPAANLVPQPLAGPSRLLPLSAHGLPAFKPPSTRPVVSRTAMNTLESKCVAGEKSPPSKRVRIDTEAEVRTIITLAPPGAVASMWKNHSPSPLEVPSLTPAPSSPPNQDSHHFDLPSAELDVEEPTSAQKTPTAEASSSEEASPHAYSLDDITGAILGETSDPASRRQIAEESVRAMRRREAERNGREEAEARRTEREQESEHAQQDLDRLMGGFECNRVRYVPLNNLSNMIGQSANVIGLVVEAQSPRYISKSGDYMMNVVIADPTTHDDGHASKDIVVTMFRKTEIALPVDVLPGTPILFRGLRISKWNDKPKGQAFTPEGTGVTSTNTWASLPGGKSLKLADPRHMYPPIDKMELDRLTGLLKWWRTIYGYPGRSGLGPVSGDDGRVQTRNSQDGSPRKRSTVELQDVQPYTFVDLIFKIMHVVRNTPPRPELELFVSDGTMTPLVPRNFHNIDMGIPAQSLFCLAVVKKPPPSEEPFFQVGNVIKLPNVRVKEYQGGIELIWSEQVTMEQAEAGWNRRRVTLLSPNDERVIAIASRIKALKRGEAPQAGDGPSRAPRPSSPAINRPHEDPVDLPPEDGGLIPVATHLWTVHTDEIDHPLSTVPDILANKSVTNKYRVKARVRSLHPRGLRGVDGFVQNFCRHCKRSFTGTYCQSCNDVGCLKAEWRYRFVVILQDPVSGQTIAAMIADEEAASFLPALPPFSASTNPNDIRKTSTQLKKVNAEVPDILLGTRLNGERTRPVIEWSIETFAVKAKHGGPVVMVRRVFGMKGR